MNSLICIEVGGYCQGYGYHIPNSSWLNLGRTHHIPYPIRKQPADIVGVPDKKRQPEFYMETTRTTQIVSILVYLVLLGQGTPMGINTRLPRRKGDTLTIEETINTHHNLRNNRSKTEDQHTSQYTPRQTAGYRHQRYAWIDPIRDLQRPAVGTRCLWSRRAWTRGRRLPWCRLWVRSSDRHVDNS